MEKILEFLEANPQLLTVAELLGKIILCVLGIIIYRRTGKALNLSKAVEKPISVNMADGISIDELEEFAVALSQTVDKIHELKERKKQ